MLSGYYISKPIYQLKIVKNLILNNKAVIVYTLYCYTNFFGLSHLIHLPQEKLFPQVFRSACIQVKSRFASALDLYTSAMLA